MFTSYLTIMICQETQNRYFIRKKINVYTFDYHDLDDKIGIMKCLICGQPLNRLGSKTCSPKHRVALMRLRDWVADDLRCDRTDTRVDQQIRLIQQSRFPDENTLILSRLERIEQLLLSRGNQAVVTLPDVSGDDLVVSQSTNEGENSAYNAILSTLALGADFNRFPSEIIAYGIEKGLIDPKHKKSEGGIKQMEVSYDLPAPEELDLEW